MGLRDGVLRRGVLLGDGAFRLRVRGTILHQLAVERIQYVRTRKGIHYRCAALLTPHSNNPYESTVSVIIRGAEVGFLEWERGQELQRALRKGGFSDAGCLAAIVGGWVRRGSDEGYVGVRLDARLPFRLCSAEEWQRMRRY